MAFSNLTFFLKHIGGTRTFLLPFGRDEPSPFALWMWTLSCRQNAKIQYLGPVAGMFDAAINR
jgi:hypothetical protein